MKTTVHIKVYFPKTKRYFNHRFDLEIIPNIGWRIGWRILDNKDTSFIITNITLILFPKEVLKITAKLADKHSIASEEAIIEKFKWIETL